MDYIDKRIGKLKKKLSKIDTRDFLGYVQHLIIPFGNDGKEFAKSCNIFNKTSFHSPVMQYKYLIGLLLSTNKDKLKETRLTDNVIVEIERATQHITDMYSKDFFKVAVEEMNSGNKDEALFTIASLENFASYFNVSSLRYPEQDIKYLKLIYGTFDTKLINQYSLNINDFVTFYHFVYNSAQRTIQNYIDTIQTVFKAFKENNIFESEEDAYRYLETHVSREELFSKTSNYSCFLKNELISEFGVEKAEKLLELFTIDRYERPFVYYNDQNPFSAKPLVKIDNERFYITYPSWLLDSIYSLLNEDFKDDPDVSKKKGDVTEDMFVEVLRNILGDNITVYTKVCEKRGTSEHDILVLYDNYILIIEAKASKPREPFFNPRMSKQRLKDHFFSKSGIGYAYSQAILLKKFLETSDEAIVYANKINKVVIKDIKTKTIIPLVGTLEDFGQIAINPTPLIKPENDQPYPWIVNISDLDNINEMIKHLSLKPQVFIDYILFRIDTLNDVLAVDELDIFEQYINGFFKNIDKKNVIVIEPRGTSLIDKIYFNKNGVPYDYKN